MHCSCVLHTNAKPVLKLALFAIALKVVLRVIFSATQRGFRSYQEVAMDYSVQKVQH